MATVTTPPTPKFRTMADVLKHLGNVPAERVRMCPCPGTATEQDVIDIEAHEDRLCELVDGILVEKPMGFSESLIAVALIIRLGSFVDQNDMGLVSGEAGMMRLFVGLVRIPDVAYIAWDRLPNRKVPIEPIPDLAPNLAVEILSKSNTRREMERKLIEYFTAGVELVWFVDPKKRTVTVYNAPDQSLVLGENDVLDGGAILPRFTFSLKKLFSKLD